METECPICLEYVDIDQSLEMPCCNIVFCIDCLLKWFDNKNNEICPICLESLSEQPSEQPLELPLEQPSELPFYQPLESHSELPYLTIDLYIKYVLGIIIIIILIYSLRF